MGLNYYFAEESEEKQKNLIENSGNCKTYGSNPRYLRKDRLKSELMHRILVHMVGVEVGEDLSSQGHHADNQRKAE